MLFDYVSKIVEQNNQEVTPSLSPLVDDFAGVVFFTTCEDV